MTLKERLQKEKLYINPHSFKLTKEGAESFEKIADEFAMKFGEHILDYHNDFTSDYLPLILEQFKKEKGL